MKTVIGVKFRKPGKVYFFDPENMQIKKEDYVIVDPFAGSGTECAMAAKENRNFWACDIEKKYVVMSNNRCREHLQNQSLF